MNLQAESNVIGSMILKINGGTTMNRLSCFFERISDYTVGLILLFFSLAFTVIGFTILPVIGWLIAIPLLVLAIVFLGARRSKECAFIAEKTQKTPSG